MSAFAALLRFGETVAKTHLRNLAAKLHPQVECFLGELHGGFTNPLHAMRQAGVSVHLREILHHLQRDGRRSALHGRLVLLPGLPGSL